MKLKTLIFKNQTFKHGTIQTYPFEAHVLRDDGGRILSFCFLYYHILLLQEPATVCQVKLLRSTLYDGLASALSF